MDLTGRRIVITGAGRGLGAAFAIVAADLGATPVLTGRSTGAVDAVAGQILARTGRQAETVALDLTDPASIEAGTAAIGAGNRPVDAIIHNGAHWVTGKLDALSPTDIFQVVNSAVTGSVLVTKALLPALLRSPTPDILVIVSIAGLENSPLHDCSVPFQAAKRGQSAVADGLRQELAGTPVRVAALFPPYIEDISPLDAAWETIPTRQRPAPVTNRDVVEAGIFALTRPRHCTIATLVLDAEEGGLRSGPFEAA